jgi:hypothetical protein
MRYLPLLLLIACAKDKDDASVDSSGTGLEHAVTWYEHVEPLIQKNCAACHDEGGLGGVTLTDSATAVMYALNLSYQVEHGTMPPPSADPTCQDYKGSEQQNLTEEGRSLFIDWAEDGAPLGLAANAPDPINWNQTLTDVDTILQIPVQYTIQPDASGNDYHCFILDNPFEVKTFITAFDVDLDNAAVVHHMVLAIDSGGNAGEGSGDTDLSDGWDCSDRLIETDWSLLHAWTPGQVPVDFQEGDGMEVEPGQQIILQMHYFHEGEEAVDQSGYKLKTAASVDRTVLMYPFGPMGFTIPASAEAHSETASLTNPYMDLEVLGVFPHMHGLGIGYEATISNPAGDTVDCLARADNYDFDYQGTYMFKDPVVWKLGDTVHTTCTWDNSEDNPNQFNEPPENVQWGEGTNEEMCFFLFYFTAQ